MLPQTRPDSYSAGPYFWANISGFSGQYFLHRSQKWHNLSGFLIRGPLHVSRVLSQPALDVLLAACSIRIYRFELNSIFIASESTNKPDVNHVENSFLPPRSSNLIVLYAPQGSSETSASDAPLRREHPLEAPRVSKRAH